MLPWISIAANTTGTVRPCCISEDVIKRPDGTPFNLATDSIMEIFHSDYMKDLRQEFIAGGKPIACRRCWNEETVGKTSKRLNHLRKNNMLLPLVNFNILEPKHFLYLDLKLGNICNLKCRICGPMISSKWAQESLMQVPYEERSTHQSKTWLVEGEWPRTSTKFWEELHNLVPKIKYLDFTGGEPFMIQEHFDLLKYSVEKGSSKYQMLYYNTNGTLFPAGAEELWKHFKHIEIAFSIDNIGPRFELERSGAKWEEVNSNIQKFREMKSRLSNIELHVNPTVNIQNVYYLEDLCAWITEQNFDYENFGLVHQARYMSLEALTPSAKELVIDKLTNGTFSDKHRLEVDKIIKFINMEVDRTGQNPNRFNEEMKKLDLIRKEDFNQTHSEIAKAMGYDAT
jgi:MoaA/NifB/PqqE/SkfB family radical SAM enzyme